MENNFTHSILGRTGLKAFRLGLSGTYFPGKKTFYKAIDKGVNFFFGYGFDFQTIKVLKDVFKKDREKLILATGAYNLIIGHPNIEKTIDKRLKQFGTDYIDFFLFLGVTNGKHFPPKLIDEFQKLKEKGKIRNIGLSCHDRKFAGSLAKDGLVDSLMIRYNAAHRGAENDIFPFLKTHDPGVISYTATRWGYLIRRHKNWEKDRPIPTPGMCYRFVLSNPNVHVCLNAPKNMKQFEENINSLELGPLNENEMKFITEYGDLVHRN